MQHYISRKDVRRFRERVYVFGDNMHRSGMRGQAAQMRGEPNTIGIPTKWEPNFHPNSYFRDSDWHPGSLVYKAVTDGFINIEAVLRNNRDIVFPQDGIGTGLAKLPEKAPVIFEFIKSTIEDLMQQYGAVLNHETAGS